MKLTLCHQHFHRDEKGQALVIVAGTFVALLALVGLVTDGALLYVNNAHLRQAVDAGAVAAAGQYRESRGLESIYTAAAEAMELQLPTGLHNVEVYWCPVTGAGAEVDNYAGGQYQPYAADLCTATPRKRVRVEAWLDVELVFLSLFGFDQIRLFAQAESEAALINLVLLLDTSESMAYGVDADGDGDVDEDPDACPPQSTAYPRTSHGQSYNSFAECLRACSQGDWCSPFEEVRTAAADFVNIMRDGVDSVAVYHFDKTPVLEQSVDYGPSPYSAWPTYTHPITIYPSSGVVVPLTSTLSTVTTDIHDNSKLHVYVRPQWPGQNPQWLVSNFRWINTNIGGGLREATTELVQNGEPDIAVWVAVLLTDGAANATDVAADENDWWSCPSPYTYQYTPTQQCTLHYSPAPNQRCLREQELVCCGAVDCSRPLCRDPEASDADPTQPVTTTVTRHCPSVGTCSNPDAVPWYTNRHLIATHPITYYYDADDYARDMADTAAAQKIVLFTIGFGSEVIDYDRGGREDAGERLLRYIADVGDDGDRSTAPCGSDFYWDYQHIWPLPDLGEDCGNYYYADEPDELEDIFEAIASRVFSRITE
ncbi:MAG: hypothetical protein SWK90_11755 [Chloroflexota bacterium]|nr:hypothetical protein [Chloroflexota bacterium]